jgi:hypothetical protein
MEVVRLDAGTVAISGLNPFLAGMLHQVAVSAEDEDPQAQARLFSSPSEGREPEMEEDWREFVQPELRQLFQTSREVVRGDLAAFPPDPPSNDMTLKLPVSHLESWLNALNQARLALAARHRVTEADMDHVPRSGDSRALALFQIHLYGLLQEWFLRELGA